MHGQVGLFLLIQLILPEFILVKIANVGAPHLLEQLGPYLLHHSLVDVDSLGNCLGCVTLKVRLASA